MSNTGEAMAAVEADATAMKDRIVDELRARRAARVADPKMGPLWRALYAEPPKQTRRRGPTVTSVIRQMQRAGVAVAGCEINPRDGTVIVRTGKPDTITNADSSVNEWDAVVTKQ